MRFIFDALKCVHCVGGLLMVRIADAHLTSAFLKVAFIVSVEGCRFKTKNHFLKLATETTPKQEMWLLGQISAGPLLVL